MKRHAQITMWAIKEDGLFMIKENMFSYIIQRSQPHSYPMDNSMHDLFH